ncbi:MAG: hypothetical protein AB7L76_01810 [Burkholderiaceae bacterium]
MLFRDHSVSLGKGDAAALPPAPLAGADLGPCSIELSSLDQAPQLLRRSRARVLAVNCNGRRVWIKGAASPHSRTRYRLLDLFSALANAPALAAVDAPGGESGIAIELRRLQSLRRAGIRVPQVLAHGPDWLCLSDLGSTTLLAAIQQAPDAAARLGWWQTGLHAILQVHSRGACLSQGFARNIIIGSSPSTIGFIDFEDDPAASMSLTHAQVRDWALFLFSTSAAVEAGGPAEAARRFRTVMTREIAGVSFETLELLRRLRWLARVPGHPRWGRDVRLARAAGRFAQAVVGQ